MKYGQIIKFCADLGKTPTETLKLLRTTRRNISVSRALVFKWHRRFKDGRQDIEDDERQGREAVIRTSRSSGKQMYAMFADHRGMILCHPVPVGQIVNGIYYSMINNNSI